MSKQINVDIFDSSSVRNAIQEVENFYKELEEKANKFVDLLGRYGFSVINAGYESAINDNVKGNGVSVTMDNVSHGTVTITATGTQVLFIEFGTGPLQPDDYEARSQLTSGNVLLHGEYSKQLGKDAIKKDGKWYYNGKRTSGIPAQSVMYKGMQAMKEKVEAVVRQVFLND